MGRKKYFTIFIAIMLIGLLFRVHCTDFLHTMPTGSDGMTYHYAAKNLLEYGKLTMDRTGEMFSGNQQLVSTSALMPGFPVFLSILYLLNDTLPFVYIIQIVLSMITLGLIYKLILKLDINEKIALIVTAIAAVYPAFCYNLDWVLTENLFTTLIVAFIFFFICYMQAENGRMIQLVLPNVMLGFAVLIRAQALPLLIVELFFMLFYGKIPKNKRIISCFVAIATVVAFMMLLWVRNWVTFGKFWLLTQAGESPKVWGAQPYFLNMSRAGSMSLQELIAGNKMLGEKHYYTWKTLGFFNFMWYDMWDENLVHPYLMTKWFRLIHPFVVVPTVMATPVLIARKVRWEKYFICCMPLVFSIMCLPYHGLSRYVFPSIPAVFVMTAMLIDMAYKKIKHIKQQDEICLENGWGCITKWCHIFFKCGYMIVCVLVSFLVFVGVFCFDDNVKTEMSDYYLGTEYGVSHEQVESLKAIETVDLIDKLNSWSIENVEVKQDGKTYRGNWNDFPIMRVEIPESDMICEDNNIVTKVELNIPGGYLYDYCTVYWIGNKTEAYSEDYVFGRFPRDVFDGIQTVYIPENVKTLMVVPCGMRGAEFSVENIKISKYDVTSIMK